VDVNKLYAFDKVQYRMNCNGINKYWDAVVVDTKPLTLRVKLLDNYLHDVTPDSDQWKYIRQIPAINVT